AGALCTDQRAVGGPDDDVAGYFFQVHFAGDALQGHVAHNLFNINQASLRTKLQLGFFRDGNLKIRFEVGRLRGVVQHSSCDVDSLTDLLRFDVNLVGGLCSGDDNFGVFPRLNVYTSIRYVLKHNDRPALYGKMFLETLTCGVAGGRLRQNDRGTE